jgi:hypothetical protein
MDYLTTLIHLVREFTFLTPKQIEIFAKLVERKKPLEANEDNLQEVM